MRCWLLAVVMLFAVGCAPADIAQSSCKSIVFATGEPWSCTVKADVVGQASSIEFTTESRNQVARVTLVLTVTKGTLRVGYRDLTGDQQLVVTPSEPADLVMQTRLHRDRGSFTLHRSDQRPG